MYAIKELLQKVNAIQKKYEHISELTGEKFNVFRILKLHAAENRTHSAFLAELLNPKGSHGQKDVFLKLFLKHLKSIGLVNDFLSENAKVQTEQHVGFLNLDKSEGGRLDICLTDEGASQIFIENKIYAGDQENQLLRYHNHNKNALLLYLCLDEKEVSEHSIKHLEQGTHFHLITYKSDIVTWLEECKKEAVSHPMLREIIAQYINLIKYLTGQTINKEIDNEIIDAIVRHSETLKAAFTITSTVDAACERLLEKFVVQMEELAKELDLTFENTIDWHRNYSGFIFYNDKWKYANITFQFWARDKRMVYGIGRDKECFSLDDELTKTVYEKLHMLGGKSTSWWPFVKDVDEPMDNWDRAEPWLAIQDGSMKVFVKEKVVKILELLNGYKL